VTTTGEQTRATVVRWHRAVRWGAAASEALQPPAFGLLGATFYALMQSPDRLPPWWLLLVTLAVFGIGFAGMLVEGIARGHLRSLARRTRDTWATKGGRRP
jgi:hypothetical protein